MRLPWLCRLLIAAVAVMAAVQTGSAAEGDVGDAPPLVVLGAIEGAIGPATVRHVEKLVDAAGNRHAAALVLRLDTPGGLADSMREIISTILGSPVPVIGWVAPPGAHAASAGTYILYATALAAMAPGTNIGAATPVQIGGMPGALEPDTGGDAPGGTGGKAPEGALSGPGAMTQKVTSDAVALIRSLAEMHGRNADWAEKAVREAASLSAKAALDKGVVEIVAGNIDELLAKADGRRVEVLGAAHVLRTANAVIERVEVGTVTRLLGILSNPNIALVLMMIGVYGIVFEFIMPGTFAPGVIGAIALTLGLYSLNQLPLDYAGLALVGLGIAFMVSEAVVPSFGALGLGGLAAFVIGSAMLVDTDVPQYRISWWLIGMLAALSGAVLILLIGYTWRIYRRRPAGTAEMADDAARVLDWEGTGGHVLAEGERWRAVGPAGLAPGERVRIESRDGLTLTVGRSADARAANAAEGEKCTRASR